MAKVSASITNSQNIKNDESLGWVCWVMSASSSVSTLIIDNVDREIDHGIEQRHDEVESVQHLLGQYTLYSVISYIKTLGK